MAGRSEELKPTTLTQLKRTREIVCAGPSGHVYRVRPLNLQRHALAGGFPAQLRQIAIRQALGESSVSASSEDGELLERAEELREYLDEVVRQVIVEPSLAGDALDLLPPVDYDWAVGVAMGTVTEDGDGQPLWGRERLTRFPEAARA